MQKNNNTFAIVGQGDKNKRSFVEWAKENSHLIESSLIAEGVNFINENAERLNTPVINLILDNKWHYIDKPKKKQSYRGEITYNSDGIPHLNLTYYTFRHGGQSARFNSKEALKALWLQERKGVSLTKPIRKTTKPQPTKQKAKPFIQVNWLKHDFEQWKSFVSPAKAKENAYLKRKGLSQRSIPGFRVGIDEWPEELLKNGFKPKKKPVVAVKIIDTQENYCGLQQIDNLG